MDGCWLLKITLKVPLTIFYLFNYSKPSLVSFVRTHITHLCPLIVTHKVGQLRFILPYFGTRARLGVNVGIFILNNLSGVHCTPLDLCWYLSYWENIQVHKQTHPVAPPPTLPLFPISNVYDRMVY